MNDAHDRLHQLDLNLLVAFDILVRERNVTRAAEVVGVTQSAMSHTLKRLRDAIGDPLFVRGRGGMIMTPRAASMAQAVRTGLVLLERAVAEPSAFDPAKARRSFRIVSPDLFDVLALPRILERIGKNAPGIDVSVLARDPEKLFAELETGEIDFVVMALPFVPKSREFPELTEDGLVRRTLFKDTFSCFLRRDHPVFVGRKTKRLSLAAYARIPHAMVSPTGGGQGFIDRHLAEHGKSRRIALRIPTFYAAPAIIAKSDLVLTAPTTLAGLLGKESPIIAVAPPMPLPEHSVAMVWHQRWTEDPGHRWVRDLVADLAKSLPIARSGAFR